MMPKYPDHLIASTALLALSNQASAEKFKHTGAQAKVSLSIRDNSDKAIQIGIESNHHDAELHQVALREVHPHQPERKAEATESSRYNPQEILSQYDVTIQLFDTCETISHDSYSSLSSSGLVRLYRKGESQAFRIISLSQIFMTLTKNDAPDRHSNAPARHLGTVKVRPPRQLEP